MSITQSPGIVTNGLICYYDMYNTQKSFKGAPTTNLIPSPELNGRFNINNGWGTINTQLYNGNVYFAIGGIAGVTGNIVTTTAAHPFTTYDVITPQTTGGGVTAGVNYFVRVLSANTFSLHAYNSSQDGSQGYINPATGTHKVYDSIVLNQQVAINATSFPTMWWGPPHLPNQCHVKEIIPNGGPEYGTPCLRIHTTRTTAVSGGMAYGVYTPVNINDVITVSFWSRISRGGVGLTMSYGTYFGPSMSSYSGSWTPTTEWQKVTFQWTASATYSFYQYFYFPAGTSPYYVEMADLQVETNRGFASPFTLSSRTTTNALIDIAGNYPITTTSPVYNSDGTFSFNGGTDSLQITGLPPSQNFTWSAWVNSSAVSGAQNIISMNGPYFMRITSSTVRFNILTDTGGWLFQQGTTTLSNNTWYYLTMVYDQVAGLWKGYINGTQEFSVAKTGTINSGYATFYAYIGYTPQGGENAPFNGKIAGIQYYNRALTQSEIQQNFNAHRGRYGV